MICHRWVSGEHEIVSNPYSTAPALASSICPTNHPKINASNAFHFGRRLSINDPNRGCAENI
jgi:hypothetical protein